VHLLEFRNISMHFGGIKAIEDLDMRVKENQIMSIIGPNGAGKTTIFNCITGLTRPVKGSIFFSDVNIVNLQPHEIARLGIARTFQNIRLFKEMSVIDNIIVAQHCRTSSGIIDAVLMLRKFRREERIIREKAMEYLEFVGLYDFANTMSGSLPYGAQRKLEIARALASEPSLILLDEPTAGMNPQETVQVMELIEKIKKLGKTVLLIEHDMKVVMGISEWIVVMDHGVKIAEGIPEDIKNNKLVIEAYLGKEY